MYRKMVSIIVLLVMLGSIAFVPSVSYGYTPVSPSYGGEDGIKLDPNIPPPKYDKVRVAVLGDTRQYVGGDPVPEVTRRILQEMSWISPDFIVNTGDLIMGHSTKEHDTYAEFIDYKLLMDRLGVPYFIIPGNHDLYPAGSETIFPQLFNPFYYYFDYQGARFIFMNSEIYEGEMQVSGGFSDEQIAWLREILDDAQEKGMVAFVFMHRPLYIPDYYGGCKVNDESGTRAYQGREDERDAVIEILNSHPNVKFVFSGHKHMYYYCDIGDDKPIYVTLGNSGAPLYGTHHRGAWYGYLILYYDPDNPFDAYFDVYQPWHYVDIDYYPKNDGTLPQVTAYMLERIYKGAHEPTVYGNVEFIMPPADRYEVKNSFNAIGEVTATEALPNGTVKVHVKTYLKNFDLGTLESYNITLKAIGAKDFKPKTLLSTKIKLVIGGEKWECPIPLRVLDGRLMVPINCLDKSFISYMGYEIDPPFTATWKKEHMRIDFKVGRRVSYVWYNYPMWIHKNRFQAEGAPTFITSDDTVNINIDGTGIYAYMWIRELAEIYGKSVEWDGKTMTVIVK